MDEKRKSRPSAVPERLVDEVARSSEPMQMTQEEVNAMAAGGTVARAAAEQLEIRTAKRAPLFIDQAEMATILESGRSPDTFQERLELSAATTLEAAEEVVSAKQAPLEAPPQEGAK